MKLMRTKYFLLTASIVQILVMHIVQTSASRNLQDKQITLKGVLFAVERAVGQHGIQQMKEKKQRHDLMKNFENQLTVDLNSILQNSKEAPMMFNMKPMMKLKR